MKTRTRGVVVVLLLTGLATVGALAQGPRPGGILTVADQVGPPSIDPHKDYSYHGSAMVLTLLYEGLLTRDDKGDSAAEPGRIVEDRRAPPSMNSGFGGACSSTTAARWTRTTSSTASSGRWTPRRGPPSACYGVRSTGWRSQTSGRSAST